jgi:hypothetical protein
MVYEQLVLFDLAPYVVQQSAVELQALDSDKVRSLVHDNVKQLEIGFHQRQTFTLLNKDDRLAA